MSKELPVYGILATLMGREAMLRQSVSSILPQVDRLFIRLNGFSRVPSFLMHDKVECELGDNLGVAVKFDYVRGLQGLVVSVDDDLAYPPDYVWRIQHGLETWGTGCIVGFHASSISAGTPWIDSVTANWVPYWAAQRHDGACHALGVGTLAYCSPRIGLRERDFPFPVGVDPQLAVIAQRRGIPMISLAREEGWIQSLWPTPDGSRAAPDQRASIWDHTQMDTASDLNARPVFAWVDAQNVAWRYHFPDGDTRSLRKYSPARQLLSPRAKTLRYIRSFLHAIPPLYWVVKRSHEWVLKQRKTADVR